MVKNIGDPDEYASLFCVYLWGVECADLPDQAVATTNAMCRWAVGQDCA